MQLDWCFQIFECFCMTSKSTFDTFPYWLLPFCEFGFSKQDWNFNCFHKPSKFGTNIIHQKYNYVNFLWLILKLKQIFAKSSIQKRFVQLTATLYVLIMYYSCTTKLMMSKSRLKLQLPHQLMLGNNLSSPFSHKVRRGKFFNTHE